MKNLKELLLPILLLELLGLSYLVFTQILVLPESIFWYFIWMHDVPALTFLAATVILALVFSFGKERTSARIEGFVLGAYRHRFIVAFSVFVLLCGLSVIVYRALPLCMDEYAAWFQARIFSAGEVTGKFPVEYVDYLIPKPFKNNFLMVNSSTGDVFSAYWPGHALILSVFDFFGVPWACNPALVALSILMIAKLALDITGERLAAGWAIVFCLASSALLVNGISYYSMPAHLLFNVVFSIILLKGGRSNCFLGGVVGGFALVLHNPLPHLAFCLPWLAYVFKRSRSDLIWLIFGYTIFAILIGVGWIVFQQHVLSDPSIAQSSASTISTTPSIGLFDKFIAKADHLSSILVLPNIYVFVVRVAGLAKLFVWDSPMLLALAVCGAAWGTSAGRVMAASCLLTFMAYFVVPFDQGHGWGYRYFHSAWGMLPVLAACFMVSAKHDSVFYQPRFILSLCILSLVIMLPLRFSQVNTFVSSHYSQFPPGDEPDLVVHSGKGFYSLDLVQNDPWLRGRTVVFIPSGGTVEAAVTGLLPGGAAVIGKSEYGTGYSLEKHDRNRP